MLIKNNYKYLIGLIILLPASRVYAQLLLTNPAPGAVSTMSDFIYLLIQIIQLIGTPILVCAIVYAGFMMVTAGGNEEQVRKSKVWILWTLVGAAIILGARSLADMVYGTASLF